MSTPRADWPMDKWLERVRDRLDEMDSECAFEYREPGEAMQWLYSDWTLIYGGEQRAYSVADLGNDRILPAESYHFYAFAPKQVVNHDGFTVAPAGYLAVVLGVFGRTRDDRGEPEWSDWANLNSMDRWKRARIAFDHYTLSALDLKDLAWQVASLAGKTTEGFAWYWRGQARSLAEHALAVVASEEDRAILEYEIGHGYFDDKWDI